MAEISAGLILFRRPATGVEIFLAHPGGPFWRNREEGAWTIPKGRVEPGEEPLATAQREFREETGIEPQGPFLDLGSVRQKAGKVVHAWAWEGDADATAIVSNTTSLEWPRRSGRRITFPEVDRCGWFGSDRARELMNPAQAELVGRLQEVLESRDSAV
jgi:predicted NUDIX family NTP pyrophosphohydrolase